MTLTIAAAVVTTVSINMLIAYILHEMGYFQPVVHDFEEEFGDAVDEVLLLNQKITALEKELEVYRAAELDDKDFETFIDEKLHTQELWAQALSDTRTQVETRIFNAASNTYDRIDQLLAFGSTHTLAFQSPFAVVSLVEDEIEEKKSYVAYPIEDAEEAEVTVRIRA